MTIKDFRGQVKVSDVQNAFDEIVNRINSQVDVYNSFFKLQDYDLTKSSPLLGASGYTLSVGGLKSVLSSYANTVIGCRTFRLDDEKLLVSDGFCITPDRVYRINAQIMGGAVSPDVKPTPSASYYYYVDGHAGVYATTHLNEITQKNEVIAAGASFNHLNSIPFEFDKVYRIESGGYDNEGSSVLSGKWKFAEFNSGLNKVVPVATLDSYSETAYLAEIPHDSSGEVITNTDPISISQSITTTSQDVGADNYLYIQKVLGADNKIKLYIFGKSKYSTSLATRQRAIGYIISDSENSTAFTELMQRCSYLFACANTSYSSPDINPDSNTDFTDSTPYYNYESTIDNVTSLAELGDAHYYSNYRPSAGNGIDVSELFYNCREDSLIYKSYEFGDDVAYVDKDSEGNYVLKLKSTGEVIQDGGIYRISYLNWKSEDVLLSGVKNLQLEDENISMTTQNVNIPCEGHARQALDTSSSGKFVSFVKRNTTNAGSTGGICNFMGLNLINSYHSESGLYRRHWVTYPINVIYIPYKFSPSMQLTGATGRYVYSYNINRKT